MNKIKNTLTILALFLTIVGLVTFSLFILEESFQTVMFGSWSAQDAKAWDVVLDGVDLMKKINRTLKIVNYSIGWIQPLAFISYRAYSHSADYYTKALEAKVFAYSPESFVGRKVKFEFTPKTIKATENGYYVLSNGRVAVITKDNTFKKRTVIGIANKSKRGIIFNGE